MGDGARATRLLPHMQVARVRNVLELKQLRRVVHLAREAPMMLLANLRTSVGLVNGAMGTLKAVVLEKTRRSSLATFASP